MESCRDRAVDQDEISFESVYRILGHFSNVPSQQVANDWQRIVRGWAQLAWTSDFKKGLWSLQDTIVIAKSKAGGDKKLANYRLGQNPMPGYDGLHLLEDTLKALCEYYVRFGSVPKETLEGILPSAAGELNDPAQLKIDEEGIDSALKDLCEEVGLPLRKELLDPELLANRDIRAFLLAHVQQRKTQDQVIKELTDKLQTLRKPASASARQPLLDASRRLLRWFAKAPTQYSEAAKQIPLLTEEDQFHAQNDQPAVLLPSSQWPPAAQGFSGIFPKRRLLHASYANAMDAEDTSVLLGALVEWGIAAPGPLLEQQSTSKKAKYLVQTETGPQVEEHEFNLPKTSVIPFLSEIIPSLTVNSPNIAKQFTSFLIGHVAAQHMTFWRVPDDATCTCHTPARKVAAAADWLVPVLEYKWVPLLDETGNLIRGAKATQESLAPYIDLAELLSTQDGASIEFMVRYLGFERFTLALHQSAATEDERRQVRDRLAKAIPIASRQDEWKVLMRAYDHYQTIASLVDAIENKEAITRNVQDNREFGLKIQDIVYLLLESHGFDPKLIDREFDFLVSERAKKEYGDEETDLTRIQTKISQHKIYLEVKATRSGAEVRMTPRQADKAMAEPDDYVLCVVDRSDFPSAQVLTPANVASSIHIVDDIGFQLKDAVGSVPSQSSSNAKIRVDRVDQLRYCVQSEVWNEANLTLNDWIAKVRQPICTADNSGSPAP